MTFHKMLISERARELAHAAAACCRPTQAPKPTPAQQLRLPMTSRTAAPACC